MGYERLVDELGVRLVDGYPPNGWWASYDHRTHTITRRPDLGSLQRRVATYHELGHAFFKHSGCDPKQEVQASIWASRQMITDSAFIEAARITDELQGIAHHLGVMKRDVEFYLRSLSYAEMVAMRHKIGWGHP